MAIRLVHYSPDNYPGRRLVTAVLNHKPMEKIMQNIESRSEAASAARVKMEEVIHRNLAQTQKVIGFRL